MSFPFTILRRLPSGGNGDLFVGRRNDTGECVVIKYLREWQFEHARRAFAREMRVLGRRVQGVMPLLRKASVLRDALSGWRVSNEIRGETHG